MGGKTEFQIAWEKFIMALADSLGIVKLLDWLVTKMNKYHKG